MNHMLDLLDDKSERVPYNSPDMPIYVRKNRVSNFLNSAASGHWHDDIEFSVILSGKMSYNINGTIYTLKQGDGIFINARQFHSNFSPDGADCEYICVLLHPVLLCANLFLEKTCVLPVLSNEAFSYSILQQDTTWKSEILADIRRIYQLYTEQKKESALLVQSLFFHMWSILYAHMPNTNQPLVGPDNRLSAFREMIGFLQKNYQEKISLSDIAAAGKVCQSNCCAIFNDYLHQTPIQYLIGYRLNKSAELLKNTSLNITEVASLSGFTGVSYYTETFRKYLGRSPSEYRKYIRFNS